MQDDHCRKAAVTEGSVSDRVNESDRIWPTNGISPTVPSPASLRPASPWQPPAGTDCPLTSDALPPFELCPVSTACRAGVIGGSPCTEPLLGCRADPPSSTVDGRW